MKGTTLISVCLVALAAWGPATHTTLAFEDINGDGYVGRVDVAALAGCVSGPGITAPSPECAGAFDFDGDGDVDGADFTTFLTKQGHLPIPLRDTGGNVLLVDSTTPYSGRQTCGTAGCHDVARISNGIVHQQGRTDAAGNIVMHDDFFGDGRWWVRSSGMYGRWSGGGGGLNRQTAGKDNANESVMDMTTFYWAFNCGGCHAGGGGMEFDRDGIRLWDQATGMFGYEVLGQSAADVALDGDYANIDTTDGSRSMAPWNVTGVAGPECLHCHRRDRTYVNQQDMHREWRAAVLSTTTELVDAAGNPVPAFAAAGTAGQGWFSTLDTGAIPPVLQLDYSVGVSRGDLVLTGSNELALGQNFLARPPRDQACWGCHLPGGFQNKRGTVWFDERDIHFKKFTNRSDTNPGNDVADAEAAACNACHPNDLDHNFAKGDSPYAQFRNELDWVNFRSCRECHLWDSPIRHPDAPMVGGGTDGTAIHFAGSDQTSMMLKLSCQACHVPYPLERAIIATDRSVTGSDIVYFTNEFLSANALDPTDTDKSKWYPSLEWKKDSDGLFRLFPQKLEVAVYWADWNQNGTPGDLSDDTIQPIILWRVRQITGNAPLPGVTDDNGDGKLEMNRPQELLLYMQALLGNDSYGRPVANNPVLVKGKRVWYQDPSAPNGVGWFEPEGSGVYVQSYETFGLDHNVLAKANAWGANLSCETCHQMEHQSPVIDRLILVDPFDENGNAVYETVRERTGINPP